MEIFTIKTNNLCYLCAKQPATLVVSDIPICVPCKEEHLRLKPTTAGEVPALGYPYGG